MTALTQNKAVLPLTPFFRQAILVSAETAFSAPTAAVDLLTAAENTLGARIFKLYAIPRAAIGTAANIQLYSKVSTTYTLMDSALMAVVTPAAAVASPKTDFGYSFTNPLELDAGKGLAGATGLAVANGIILCCWGAFYG